MKDFSVQQIFLDQVKRKIPPTTNIVDELSDLLQISTDSVYRRLRGKTSLSLEEAFIIAQNYHISLDTLQEGQILGEGNHIVFSELSQAHEEMNIKLHLEAILEDFKQSQVFTNRKLYITALDIPVYYYFKYDNLARFKIQYWDTSFLNTSHQQIKEEIDKDLLLVGKRIYEAYQQIPSLEIWTETTINSTLEHISFCQESGLITKDWAITLLDELSQMLDDLRKKTSDSSLEMYHSDVSLGNNITIVHLDDRKTVYMSVNTFGIMKTDQNHFVEKVEVWKERIIQKSTLISGVSEKYRMKFFNSLFDKVEKTKNRL